MGRYAESGFGMRTPDKEGNWKPLELEEFRINKPTIICLGGNGSTDVCKAKRMCGMAARLLNLKDGKNGTYFSYSHIDVLGFHYGRDSEDTDVGYFTKDYIERIVNNLFLPLCVDENGELFAIDRMKFNFSMITFLAHCHGAVEINNILSNLRDKLIEKGLTEDEVYEVYSQSFQVTYSPLPDEHFVPTVRIDSFIDSHNIGLSRFFKDIYNYWLDGVAIKYDDKGKFRTTTSKKSHQEIISVFSSKLVNNTTQFLDEHSIYFLERNSDWTINTNPDRANGAQNADAVSRICARSLEFAVENSIQNYINKDFTPKKPLTELQAKLNNVLKAFSSEDLKRPQVTSGFGI